MEGYSWYDNPWHEGNRCCWAANKLHQGNCPLRRKNTFIIYPDDRFYHGGIYR